MSGAASLKVEPFDPKTHDRTVFDCGIPELDNYLKNSAGQDARRRMAVTYVAADSANRVVGFYTLSSDNVATSALPPEVVKKLRLPRYDSIPAMLIGRLAVDRTQQGQGLGSALLVDALRNCYQIATNTVAAAFVIVDAKNDRAKDWYKSFSFVALPDQPKRLFIPTLELKEL